MQEPTNLFDFETRAQARMPTTAWDYYASGANAEVTLRRNEAAFDAIELHPKVLVDVHKRDLTTQVLGSTLRLPVMLAPSAFHRLAHETGELGTVRAAGKAGTVMILSTLSNTPVEEVTAAATGPVWFQLYVYRDRGATEALVQRVKAAGCEALVLTVDAPVLGHRERDARNRFALPEGLMAANMLASGYEKVAADGGGSGLAQYFQSLIDPALTWKDVEWLRAKADMPVLVKGILRADDAQRAVDHGASGIVVSNHGGRQLDTTPATIEVLPRIKEHVGEATEVFIDGGIRRGTDVIKALAYGARAVLIGRPVLWGLGSDGEAGVTAVLDLLHREIDTAMALCGCPNVDLIGQDLVGWRGYDPRHLR